MKQYNNMYYDIINGEVRITGLISDYETSITIPEYIENKPVVRFKDRAFAKVVKNGSLKIIKICGNIMPRFGENPFLGVPKITIYDKDRNRLKSLKEIYYFGSKSNYQNVYAAWNGILPNEDLTRWYTCFNDLNSNNTNIPLTSFEQNINLGLSIGDIDKPESFQNIYQILKNKQPLYENFEIVLNNLYFGTTTYIDLEGQAQNIQITINFTRNPDWVERYPNAPGLTGYMTITPNAEKVPTGNNWRYNHIVACGPNTIVTGSWVGRPYFQVTNIDGGAFSSRVRRADFNAEYNTGKLLENDMPILEEFYSIQNGFNNLTIDFTQLKADSQMTPTFWYLANIKVTGFRLKEKE